MHRIDADEAFKDLSASSKVNAEWAFLAYLRSWSATQRYLQAQGEDPVAALTDAFTTAWGDAAEIRPVRWSLALRVGRCG